MASPKAVAQRALAKPVTSVSPGALSPADALANVLQEHERETKLSLARSPGEWRKTLNRRRDPVSGAPGSNCYLSRIAASSSRKAVDFSPPRATRRFPSPRCASAIQIVCPLESTAEILRNFRTRRAISNLDYDRFLSRLEQRPSAGRPTTNVFYRCRRPDSEYEKKNRLPMRNQGW
jgi:hypothetical protein